MLNFCFATGTHCLVRQPFVQDEPVLLGNRKPRIVNPALLINLKRVLKKRRSVGVQYFILQDGRSPAV